MRQGGLHEFALAFSIIVRTGTYLRRKGRAALDDNGSPGPQKTHASGLEALAL